MSDDLVIANDYRIQASIIRFLARRPDPRQAGVIMQSLRRTARRVHKVRVRRTQITGDFIQRVMAGENAGDASRTQSSV